MGGQTISTNISYEACGGTLGWSLNISADGGSPSSLCVTTPFMGRNAEYSEPYASGGTSDYWEFILGDLHEAWNMNSAGYYPISQILRVKYAGDHGASVNADQVDQNACDNHNTGGPCADNVTTPSISEDASDIVVFTNSRE